MRAAAATVEQAPRPPRSLRATTAQGALWSMSQAVFVRVMSLIGFVVLARLLTPEQYGLVAIANVFVVLLQTLTDGGCARALIELDRVDRTDLDTVFWMALGVALALAAVLSILAWPLAGLYGEPELRPVLQVLSLSFVVDSLSVTHRVVLQRRLDFRALAWTNMAAIVASTAVAIGFAVLGFGVWSLVAQSVAGPVAIAALIMPMSGYRPGASLSLARFRDLFARGRNYLGMSLMSFLNQRSDDFLIGAYLGAGVLGIYSVAYRVHTVLIKVFSAPAQTVAFPVFARVRGNADRLRRGYISGIRMSATTAFPGYFFVLAAAPELVDVVFGEKWHEAVPVMRILSLFGPVSAVSLFNWSLLQGVGRARAVFRISTLATVLQIAGFFVAVRYGIEWVAATFVLRAYAVAPIGLALAARHLRQSALEPLRAVIGPLLACAVMVAALLVLGALAGDRLSAGPQLLVLVAVAPLVYLGALRVADRRAFSEAIGFARHAIRRS